MMKANDTYPADCFCPIVHDFVTMWPPIPGEKAHTRHLRNLRSANAKAQTKKARAKG